MSVARQAGGLGLELQAPNRQEEWLLPSAAAVDDTYGHSSSSSPVSRRAYRAFRSVFDRVLAAVALVVLLPVLLAIAIIIRLDSGSPVLFRQARVGRNGKAFMIHKFRTLEPLAPTCSVKVSETSSLITRVGRILRRSGLDELPQLWNVVRGDMALIGPRPEQAGLMHLYEPWQLKRHSVKPGITGWWQVHHRDGVPLHHHVEKDLYYIDHQGPWIDFLVVVGTLRVLWMAANQFMAAQGVEPAPVTGAHESNTP